jgi:hypothetical protein
MEQSTNIFTVSGLTNVGKSKTVEINLETITDVGVVKTDKIEQTRNHLKYELAIRTGESQILLYYESDEEVSKVVNEIYAKKNWKY